jgi:hypothetical protein
MEQKLNAEAKFIEVTTISVGVFGAKSKQHRAMLNVQMIESIQSCEHPEDASVQAMIDMHSGEPRPKRYFTVEPYETVANLVKQALA